MSYPLKFMLFTAFTGSSLASVDGHAAPYGPYMSLGGEIADVEFTERVDGRVINSEEGNLLYGGLTLGYRRPNDVYLAASFTFSKSSIDYEGLSQLGQSMSTRTQYDIGDFSVLLGRSYSRGALYAGVGRRTTERDIREAGPIQGLVETQENLYGIAGADLVFYEDGSMRVKWDTRLTTSFDSKLDIRFPNSLDNARLDTGRDHSIETEMEFLRYLPNHWSIAVTPRYVSRSTRRSDQASLSENGAPTGLTYFHPETRRKELGLRVTVSRYF